jgi:hypothetical protein
MLQLTHIQDSISWQAKAKRDNFAEQPYINSRLTSLWEIMKPFSPGMFLRIAEVLNSGQRPNPGPKRKPITTPEEMEVFLKDNSFALREITDALFLVFERVCRETGLKASAATVRVMREALKSDPDRVASKEWEPELRGRLIDEMNETLFFSLSSAEGEYFSEPRQGWEKIIERFEDTVGDIEEARKCFALSRYAAAVFHTLQVVELGLIELGTFIGVTDPKSGWTAVTNRLRKIMNTGYNERTDFEKQNSDFLEQVQGTIEALRLAWRNKISHAQNRLVVLGSDFTPDIAEEIIFATRGFMRRLADGLPVRQEIAGHVA